MRLDTTSVRNHHTGVCRRSAAICHHPRAVEPDCRRLPNQVELSSCLWGMSACFSMIFLAVVDANYKFVWISVGAIGTASDAQLFNNCELKNLLGQDNLGLPPPSPLPGDDKNTPYFYIADDAFPLRTWMMNPYSRCHLTEEEAIPYGGNCILNTGHQISVHAWLP